MAKKRKRAKKILDNKAIYVAILLFVAGFLAGYFFKDTEKNVPTQGAIYDNSVEFYEPSKPKPKPKPETTHKKVIDRKPIIEKDEKEPPKPVAQPAPPTSTVAIIIDDLGGNLKMAERFMKLDIPVAFAILPHLARSVMVAEKAHEAGLVVMLHLPMEAKGKDARLGPGALYVNMGKRSIEKQLFANIDAVPHVVGVNNHMGSLFTERSQGMEDLVSGIKKRGLFFVDSRTTPKTVAYDVALAAGAPTARRDVFLDNERDVEKIVLQIKDLADKAIKRGRAIGICHPYPQTLQALKRASAIFRDSGVKVVPVTQLLIK